TSIERLTLRPWLSVMEMHCANPYKPSAMRGIAAGGMVISILRFITAFMAHSNKRAAIISSKTPIDQELVAPCAKLVNMTVTINPHAITRSNHTPMCSLAAVDEVAKPCRISRWINIAESSVTVGCAAVLELDTFFSVAVVPTYLPTRLHAFLAQA